MPTYKIRIIVAVTKGKEDIIIIILFLGKRELSIPFILINQL